MTQFPDTFTTEELSLLSSVKIYVESGGRFFPGHRLITLAAKLDEEVGIAVSRIEVLGNDVRRLSTENRVLQAASDEKGKIISSLRDSNLNLVERIQDLNSQVASLQQENGDLRDSIAHKLQQLATYTEQIRDLSERPDLSKRFDRLQVRVKSLQADKDSLSEALDVIEERAKDLRTELDSEKQDNITLRRELAEVKSKLQAAETNVGSILKMHKGEKTRAQDAEHAVLELQAERDSLRKDLERLALGQRATQERAATLEAETTGELAKELENYKAYSIKAAGLLVKVSKDLMFHKMILREILCATCSEETCPIRSRPQEFRVVNLLTEKEVDLELWAQDLFPALHESVAERFAELYPEWEQFEETPERTVRFTWRDDVDGEDEQTSVSDCEDCPYEETCQSKPDLS